jgi:UDP-glucuronate 4-epimerase
VAPWRILNLGNSQPVELMRYIQVFEEKLGRKAKLDLMPMQPGDVTNTDADVSDTARVLGYAPKTPVEVGVGRFVDWYLDFYGKR